MQTFVLVFLYLRVDCVDRKILLNKLDVTWDYLKYSNTNNKNLIEHTYSVRLKYDAIFFFF